MSDGWMDALREACASSSQSKVAKVLGYSATAINQVLSGAYRGSTQRLEAAVRGALMGQALTCPVMEEITLDICLHTQKLPYASTNSQRVKLYKACKTCPHNMNNGPLNGFLKRS